MVSLLMLGNDSESINQGELLKMKRELASITDLIGTEWQYEVYYTGIRIFGTFVQFFQAMGVTYDLKASLKYADLLKDDKYAFINFFSSLDNFVDILFEEPLNKLIAILDELGAHELNRYAFLEIFK